MTFCLYPSAEALVLRFKIYVSQKHKKIDLIGHGIKIHCGYIYIYDIKIEIA